MALGQSNPEKEPMLAQQDGDQQQAATVQKSNPAVDTDGSSPQGAPVRGRKQQQQQPLLHSALENLPPPNFVLSAAAIFSLLLGLFLVFAPPFFLDPPAPAHTVFSTVTETVTSLQTPTYIPDQSASMSSEQTFIAIKPDGVQRGLVGPIVSRFESRGFKLVAIKLVSPSKDHLETHYADLKEKPFFPGLVQYMLSGPICAMVWEGRDAVKTGRTILGATNPLASAPGTIRGDFAIDVGRNVCHGSDSVENAKKEIALWFKDEELISWKSAQFDWIYEKA
ncbi:unnamed protein product [Parascedosporium putredinis]|uniref:Nucleoside diphosphate kinase n=1 Tax=Parascedosporium putredinis TaxID=1442378 RepID=A0A9P1H1U0_9PEZI|nr:unnamed protein product [Parascedosporium putredinis]CAI7993048.1 unnamed protein product [Parascedosporium putredinis]